MKNNLKVDPTKAKVYGIYNKITDRHPHSIVVIEEEKCRATFETHSSFLSRLKVAWTMIIHGKFTITSPRMEEKTEKEITDWSNGKGLH